MRRWRRALLLACVLAAGPGAASAQGPVGQWLTQDRHGVVAIAPCGARLCGQIVGIGRFQPDGSTPRDARGVSDCHLPLMPGMTRTGDNLWRGSIYNPENGKTYDAEMHVDEQDRLRLRGFIVLPLFGTTQVWTRYKGHVTADCHMSGG